MLRMFTANNTTSIASGAEKAVIIEVDKHLIGSPVVRLAVAGRETGGTEVPRRLIGLKAASASTQWPREGFANAELFTGTGLQASEQCELEIIQVGDAGKVTVTVRNYHPNAMAECDLAIWIDDNDDGPRQVSPRMAAQLQHVFGQR
jgi:hypothetical protein